jgi:thiosulfate/3-mercaptopyruvate sulfurtransferase
MNPLVSPQWLQNRLTDPSVVILDASIEFQIPGEQEKDTRNVIPGARRFDYDNDFCDQESQLPHMMPSAEHFNHRAQALGLNNDSTIVVYDNTGTFASPRAWWMLRAMGHQNVVILDGGLTAWKSNGYPVETHYQFAATPGNFCGHLNQLAFVDANDVLNRIDNQDSLTIDARGRARFHAEVAEPRPGIRSGHIPNSICIPFIELMDHHRLKSPDQLKPYFDAWLPHPPSEFIFSCGSGVTACIVLVAAVLAGLPEARMSVYDGSWTEWGQSNTLPIER